MFSYFTGQELSHGVENLKMSFQNRSSFGTSTLEGVFSPVTEWEHVSASHCQKIDENFSEGDFSRCFKYSKNTEEADDIVYAIAEIVPRTFPSYAVPIDLTQTSDTYDPKQVIFQLKTSVSVYSAHEDEYE